MTAASAKPRPRKRAAVESGNGDAGALTGTLVDIKPEDGARRIFRGVKLPEVPVFTLESASDPDVVAEFTGIAALPGLPALRLVVDGISIETLPVFFREVLGEDQYEKFTAFADDPDNGITLDVLIELAKYLIEEYTGRPTKGSTAS
jgi:hypothetical protein